MKRPRTNSLVSSVMREDNSTPAYVNSPVAAAAASVPEYPTEDKQTSPGHDCTETAAARIHRSAVMHVTASIIR